MKIYPLKNLMLRYGEVIFYQRLRIDIDPQSRMTMYYKF